LITAFLISRHLRFPRQGTGKRLAGMARILRDLIVAAFQRENAEIERNKVREAGAPYGSSFQPPARGFTTG